MDVDGLYWLAVYWSDYLERHGVEAYMEARYGLGEQEDHPELRLSEQPAVGR